MAIRPLSEKKEYTDIGRPSESGVSDGLKRRRRKKGRLKKALCLSDGL
ncbi:hypothetical protein ACLD9W_09320 [Neisseria sp. WLZKY-1]